MAEELKDEELDAVVGGREDPEGWFSRIMAAGDDLLIAISCADIDDERVEEKSQVLAQALASHRRVMADFADRTKKWREK